MNGARVLLPLLIGLSLTATRPASAQWSAPATMQYGMGLGPINLMIGNLSFGQLAFDSIAHPKGSQAQKAQQASLSFTRSPSVAEEFKSKFIANVVKQGADHRLLVLAIAEGPRGCLKRVLIAIDLVADLVTAQHLQGVDDMARYVLDQRLIFA